MHETVAMNTHVTIGIQLSLPQIQYEIHVFYQNTASINIVRIIIMLRSANQHKITLISQNSGFLTERMITILNHAI